MIFFFFPLQLTVAWSLGGGVYMTEVYQPFMATFLHRKQDKQRRSPLSVWTVITVSPDKIIVTLPFQVLTTLVVQISYLCHLYTCG